MGRPQIITTERLVEAARALFIEHGATMPTSQIARHLGISEGTIYKRFGTKEQLFHAAMGLPDCDFVQEWAALAGTATVRENIVSVGRTLVGFYRELLPRVVMLCAQSGPSPVEVLRSSDNPPPVVILGALADYFLREIELGRMATGDPRAAARLLVGAVHNAVFFEVVGLESLLDRDADSLVDDIAETLWQGLRDV